MLVKKLYIIRHGETEFNKLNIVQGSGVDTDLNETGRTQAGLFYQAYMQHPFNEVYTSALKRSQQSVAGFLEMGLPHIIMPELNEISWGDFEGKQQTIEQRTIYWEMIHKWNAGELDAKIPNGESPIEMQARQQKVKQAIIDSTASEILVCMHGRAMKSFLCLLLDVSLTRMEDFPHTNLCLYQLEYENNTFKLVKSNDTLHLAAGRQEK
ncbi:MAG: histidine phosphatase family protein [Bacteroidota bacterium]